MKPLTKLQLRALRLLSTEGAYAERGRNVDYFQIFRPEMPVEIAGISTILFFERRGLVTVDGWKRWITELGIEMLV